MGFLRRNNNAKPDYTALQIQTSTSTLPIPIVWGQNKLAPNLLWYDNFQAVPGSSAARGSAARAARSAAAARRLRATPIAADLIIGLCEGPISRTVRTASAYIWKDLAIYVPLELGLGIYPGDDAAGASGPIWRRSTPTTALAYQGTAYALGRRLQPRRLGLDRQPQFRDLRAFAGTGVNGVDADPALVIYDFLTNAQYGAGLNPASIDATTLFGSGGDAIACRPIAGRWGSPSRRSWPARSRPRAS